MSGTDPALDPQMAQAQTPRMFWRVFWAAFLGAQTALLTCWGAAVVAGLVSPSVFGTPQNRNSRADFTRADVVSGLSGALDLYRAHVGTYPRTEDGGLQLLLRPPSDPDAARSWQGPYVKREQRLEDAWGRPYHYRCPGEHHPESYDLWSTGPVVGPEDHISNWEK